MGRPVLPRSRAGDGQGPRALGRPPDHRGARRPGRRPPELARLEVDGVEYFLDPETPDLLAGCRAEARGTFLLPGFDEFVLGYGERGAVLDPAFADRIVPGGNGMFRPTVVSDGRIVGTWQWTGRGEEGQ